MTLQSKDIEAWACHGKDQPLEKFSYQARELGPNDVEIEIHFCGVCGSDLHTIDSGWTATNYPVVPGHEIVGNITAVGTGVNQFVVGDRVGVGNQCGACLEDSCYPCSTGNDVHCSQMVETYESRWPDGSKTYGGYARFIRIQSDYAFKLPENLDSESTGPLLCAGVTVYTPMIRNNFQRGDKIGIVGMGGLGHLAVQFGVAFGCHVTVISSSLKKRDDALALGASNFVVSTDKNQTDRLANALDSILVCSCSDNNPWNLYCEMLKMKGKICLLAIPEADLKINPGLLVLKSLSMIGSLVGSKAEVAQMLEFAAKHSIKPWVEVHPMSEVNSAIECVRNNNVRYRIVLKSDF